MERLTFGCTRSLHSEWEGRLVSTDSPHGSSACVPKALHQESVASIAPCFRRRAHCRVRQQHRRVHVSIDSSNCCNLGAPS
jgi:hypothetical protein